MSRDLQGWYEHDNESGPVRVRATVEGRGLTLFTLSGRMLAHWSLDHLQNLGVPSFDRRWVVRDSRLPGPTLTLENDEDYACVQQASSDLVPPHRRTWRQIVYAGGRPSGLWASIILVVLLSLAGWLW